MEINLYQGLLEFNWNLLFSVITVLVLYGILKHFFFEKVHFFMMERQAHVEEQLTHAEETHKKAEVLLEEYSQLLANVEEEKRRILKDAKVMADQRALDIIADAKEEAGEIMSQAHKKIELEEEKAVVQLRKEIASLAVMAAERIMEKDLADSGQEEIVDKVLEEAAEGKWQNH